MSADKKPLWAKCRACTHCWAVAYLPIDMEVLANIVDSGFACPKCGDAKPVLAEQSDGLLLDAFPA